jgi:hypothetical protein
MFRISGGVNRWLVAASAVLLCQVTTARAEGLLWSGQHVGNGPWSIDYGDNLWGSTWDPVIVFGYNQNKDGVPYLTGEPGLSLGIEGNYWVANGNNKMEIYFQYIDGEGGLPIRPLFFSFNRQTRQLDNAFIGGTPVINFGDANTMEVNAQITRNGMSLFGPDTSQGTVLRLQTEANSRQPGVIQFGYDGLDNVFSIFPVNRTQTYFQIGGTNGLRYYRNPMGGSAAGSIAVGGIDDNSAIGVFGSENASGSVKALVARGKSSMAVPVFEVQSQDGAAVHSVDTAGVVFLGEAPAPATPANGVYLYVDRADNKLKYRDASGVVRVIATTAATPPPADQDGDGIPDASDNCTLVANPDQFDGDGDGYGNLCDGDLNNDGNTDEQDTILFQSLSGSSNPVADLNHDGVVNAKDTAIFRQLLGRPPGPAAGRP